MEHLEHGHDWGDNKCNPRKVAWPFVAETTVTSPLEPCKCYRVQDVLIAGKPDGWGGAQPVRIPPGIISQETLLRKIVDMINGRLDLQGNISCAVIEVPDSGLAGAVITVSHSLGRVPIAYMAMPDRACSIYDYQRSQWTASTMTLKCSVANAVINLVVF